MIKIAINGFGRIGRPTLKRILTNHPNLEVAAINDLTDASTLSHLLRYDSLYGIYEKSVEAKKDTLLIDGREIKILSEPEPEKLPWKKLGIDIVLECTGIFTTEEGAGLHLKAGAKKVIISSNSKTETTPHFILGVNHEDYNSRKGNVLAMGSCTTNCLAPICKVLNENFKIVRGFMTTTHSYTTTQNILDLPHKDLRRARAAAVNLIPTTTGAARGIGRIIPDLEGKLDGIALRVPVPVVSFLDFVCIVEKKTTIEELNFVLKKASQREDLKGILGVEDAPLVSSDYKGNSFSAIIDSSLTNVNDDLIKVCAWYDNEYAYACRLAEFADYVGSKL